MIWTICFSVALVILAVCLALVVVGVAHRRKKKPKILYILIASTFLMSVVLFLPVYANVFSGHDGGTAKTILLSFHNAIRLFVVDADYMLVVDNIQGMAQGLSPYYTVLMGILFVVCPIFTFGFILSFFKNAFAYIKLYLNYFNDVYVFSELNDKSVALASDIKKNHPRALMVFCDVSETNSETSFELTGEVNKLGAVCFNKDLMNVGLKFHASSKNLYFFTISSNDNENLKQALAVVATYGEVKNTHLYLFATNVESEMLLSSIENKQIKVRRVNEARSLINNETYYNGPQIFESALQGEDGVKRISAVIIGLDAYGNEMLKTLVWYCQMDGYKYKINAFSTDENAESKFNTECPELVKYDYGVNIHSGEDFASTEFENRINEIVDATYVFVAIGSDDENISMAVRLRTLFERIGVHPVIKVVVRNSKLAGHLKGLKNYRKQSYDLSLIGSFEEIYSEAVIIDSELENEAIARHKKWGEEKEFWQYEYNYRSSTASAIHMKARIACKIPGADKLEEELTPEEIAIIEPLEHRRWNAYMRSQGYIYSGSTDKETRNDLGKMHHDLVPFDELTEEEKLKDRKVGSK